MKPVRNLFATLGVSSEQDLADLVENSASFEEEFKKVKRAYFRAALQSHPDKPSGDTETFRKVQSAFETLRSIFDRKVVDSYGPILKHAAARYRDGSGEEAREGAAKYSWDYYAAASEEPVPTYRLEKAKSGRSRCRAMGLAKKCGAHGFVAAGTEEAEEEEEEEEEEGKGKGKSKSKRKRKKREGKKGDGADADAPSYIAKGAIRVGVIDVNGNGAGYGMWVHLACWRVPSKVWLGLPDPEVCSDASSFCRALERMSEV